MLPYTAGTGPDVCVVQRGPSWRFLLVVRGSNRVVGFCCGVVSLFGRFVLFLSGLLLLLLVVF